MCKYSLYIHRRQVLILLQAFHPTKRAIATCGMDYTAKIWPLPPFPDPSPVPIPTPLGYRPIIMYFPLFSTSRLHYGFLDWIEW